MMTLNDVKGNNRKKPIYYNQSISDFNRILFFVLKIRFLKKVYLIKNDDIKPD